jgi:hypothetical protein
MQAAPPAIILLFLPVWLFLVISLASKGNNKLSAVIRPKMINTRDQLLSRENKKCHIRKRPAVSSPCYCFILTEPRHCDVLASSTQGQGDAMHAQSVLPYSSVSHLRMQAVRNNLQDSLASSPSPRHFSHCASRESPLYKPSARAPLLPTQPQPPCPP